MDTSIVFHRATETGSSITLPLRGSRLEERLDAHIMSRRYGWVGVYIRRASIVFCGTHYSRWTARVAQMGRDRVRYPWGCMPSPNEATLATRTSNTAMDAASKALAAVNLSLNNCEMRNDFMLLHGRDDQETFDERVNALDWEAVHVAEGTPILALQVPESGRRSFYDRELAFAVIRNPRLQDVEFQAVIDPFTAFQEISMYLSGVIGSKGNPMVQLSDDEIRDKHGFDPVYGFRKLPTKHLTK